MKKVRLKVCASAAVFICLVLIIIPDHSFAQQAITKYQVYNADCFYQGKHWFIIRKFDKGGTPNYLAVDPNTLEASIIDPPSTIVKELTWKQIQNKYPDVPFFRAIKRAAQQSFAIQDAGIIHGYPQEKGITLTIDLCPSHKPLDRVIFNSLISEFKKTERPVPVALSISGRFMLTHADDINWLKGLVDAGELSITWVNHTYNHHYSPGVPLQENFLLKPGTDINFEILGTELAMLQHGLTPSVFFRFPGLVSDNRVVDKVLTYGLIPVGSDAWLAKGQNANQGSIVLIHGNGNEPIGVNDLILLLQTNKALVFKREWLLYDLRESVEDEFKN
jgi:hypothetical protein